MAVLYCLGCCESLGIVRQLPVGVGMCVSCGSSDLACLSCDQRVPLGSTDCPRCSLPANALLSRRQPAAGAVVLPDLPTLVPVVPRVSETYQGGSLGVEAVVTIPAGDVELMNALGQMVPALHSLASRLNGFRGMTDHTRELIRAMRNLATMAQEEIEVRRGPR